MNRTWFWVFLTGLLVGIAIYRRQVEEEGVVKVA